MQLQEDLWCCDTRRCRCFKDSLQRSSYCATTIMTVATESHSRGRLSFHCYRETQGTYRTVKPSHLILRVLSVSSLIPLYPQNLLDQSFSSNPHAEY